MPPLKDPKVRAKRLKQSEIDELFVRAAQQQQAGKLKSSFRLFLTAAKAGDASCQINLGNFYADGNGVKPDREAALYWYRRAYRRGHASAASNIGVVFRGENKPARALAWFERAVKLGDADANLEIAKIYLRCDARKKAAPYLKEAVKAHKDEITQASREEAARLLLKMGTGYSVPRRDGRVF